jgi:hypothetical protein
MCIGEAFEDENVIGVGLLLKSSYDGVLQIWLKKANNDILNHFENILPEHFGKFFITQIDLPYYLYR